jgi:excisionase family DNA binding protein
MLVTHLLFLELFSFKTRMNKAMEKLTFEQLPAAVATLLEKVTRIEELLSGGIPGDLTAGQMLTTAEAAEYMGISLSSVYKLTSQRTLPVYKPNGKKVYLKREDIDRYLSSHRLCSAEEIEQEAINYVLKNPLKGR